MMRHFDGLAESYADWPETTPGNWHKAIHFGVLDRAELDHRDVLLDLGCGTGRLVQQVAPHVLRSVGVDASPGMLALARARKPPLANVDWVIGDLRNPPNVEGLSTVTMCYAVRYLDSDERTALFRKLHRRMGRDGLLVIGDILWSMAPDVVDEVEGWLDEGVAHTVLVSEIERELRDAGWWPWVDRVHPALAVIRCAWIDPRDRDPQKRGG